MTRDRVLLLTAAGAGAAGLAVSGYLTAVHSASAPLVCPATATVDCERVLSSPYAVLPGSTIPTSAAGVAWFAISLVLVALLFRRPASAPLRRLLLGWAALGLISVLYLIFIEVVVIGAICAWCTVVHVLVLAFFLVALVRWLSFEPKWQSPT